MSSTTFTVDDHFAGKAEVVRAIYDRLVAACREFGQVQEDPKKTSIHLNRTSAFAGIRTGKAHLWLTIKSDQDRLGSRVHKSERTSASRVHHEVKLTAPDEVDDELIGWLKRGYELS